MALIKIPTPPKSSMNQDRLVSGLLKSQILHLQEAELRLPAKYQTNVYIHSIRTEGQAGEYIREVTKAIHAAHASRLRLVKKPKPAATFEIAAEAKKTRKTKKPKKAKASSTKKKRKK
jgi:hypothetical protein